MDFDFTKDPAWIAERQKLWEPEEIELSDGFSKKNVALWKKYFFSGEIQKGQDQAVGALVRMFPSFTVEGLHYCFKHNIKEKLSNDEFKSIQYIFYGGGIKRVPGLTLDQQLEMFRYVYGSEYDPARDFPFLIGNETSLRKITLHANVMYSSYMNCCYRWLQDLDEEAPIWVCLPQYLISLLPYLDKKLFSLQMAPDSSPPEYIDGPVRLGQFQSIPRKLMRWSFDYPDPSEGAPEGEQRRQFLRDFRELLDGLKDYPGELKQIWESIKAEYN